LPLRTLGVVLICVGLCLVLYFWVLYDTTVPVYPQAYPAIPDRVYNVGLMHNRTVGVMIGIGCLAAGVALALFGRRRT
jgi:hypothetical protein